MSEIDRSAPQPDAVGALLERGVGRLVDERAEASAPMWEASRRWPRHACTPHWVVQRKVGAQFVYVENDKGRTKRFRREDYARAEAVERNKTPNAADKPTTEARSAVVGRP